MSESPTTDDELTGEPKQTPPGEHDSELSDENSGSDAAKKQAENAESSLDQPSQ